MYVISPAPFDDQTTGWNNQHPPAFSQGQAGLREVTPEIAFHHLIRMSEGALFGIVIVRVRQAKRIAIVNEYRAST